MAISIDSLFSSRLDLSRESHVEWLHIKTTVSSDLKLFDNSITSINVKLSILLGVNFNLQCQWWQDKCIMSCCRSKLAQFALSNFALSLDNRRSKFPTRMSLNFSETHVAIHLFWRTCYPWFWLLLRRLSHHFAIDQQIDTTSWQSMGYI